MKTVEEIVRETGISSAQGCAGLTREVSGVYCCDLLSMAMTHAPSGCAWVTVIAHLNTVAVAVLREVSCIVIAEGVAADEEVSQRAREQGVALLYSNQPAFETASAIAQALV